MKPRKELAGAEEGERAPKVIVAEPAEGRDALAGGWRLPAPGEPLGTHPQFGKQFGHALGKKLRQSRFLGITRHHDLIMSLSAEPGRI
jgi:hypothetical protein